MSPGIDSGQVASKTATGTTSAVATITGIAGRKFYITDISGSSDKAGAIILVKDGTTVIWQDVINNTVPYTKDFTLSLPVPTVGADISVTVDGTSASKANLLGYFI